VKRDNKIHSVTKDVTWIGVLDPDLVTFDVVMETKYGTSYNSYFINAQKKTIVETVKEKFWDVWLEKVKKVVDPEDIDYIIMDHTEPDHSGCLGKLLEIAKNATVVASGTGIRNLQHMLGYDFRHIAVRDGQELDLGDRTAQFISAPNLHWPDSMFTYLPADEVLFTCDAFGEHFCSEEVFDDLSGDFDDAFRYYFDVIMSPFSKFLVQAVCKIRPLSIRAVCTGHGPVLRKNWKKYIGLSEEYALEAMKNPKPNTVLIAYVSAYKNTGIIAEKIAEGVRMAGNVEVDLCDLEKVDLAEVERKIIRSSAIILGSPTFNQNILLPVWQVFSLLNPIRDRGKLAGAFGSFGWSGEGTKLITTALANLKLKVMPEPLEVAFTPHKEDFEKCNAFGKSFGVKLLGKE
jgi:NADH oxidase (H2O-forming)